MSEVKIRVVQRDIESKGDAFLFGLAETLGRGLAWIVLGLIVFQILPEGVLGLAPAHEAGRP